MKRRPGAPGLLASVRTPAEAVGAVAGGADIVDAKDPALGALGALAPATLRAIVRSVAGRVPVSATTGDLPLDAASLAPAVQAVTDCGVDLVKIGVFGPVDPDALERCLAALPALAGNPRAPRPPPGRIAVLMADQGGADWPLAIFARHGFLGVMLDTADKRRGGLRRVTPAGELAAFVADARELGLMVGLAGALMEADIAPLAILQPDYLGFRTALCDAEGRTGNLDAHRLAGLREALNRSAHPSRPVPAV